MISIKKLKYTVRIPRADGGIPAGGLAAFQAGLRRRRSTGAPASGRFAPSLDVRTPPSGRAKKGMLLHSFCARRRRDSNPRDPEVKRISSAPRYDRFDTSACIGARRLTGTFFMMSLNAT